MTTRLYSWLRIASIALLSCGAVGTALAASDGLGADGTTISALERPSAENPARCAQRGCAGNTGTIWAKGTAKTKNRSVKRAKRHFMQNGAGMCRMRRCNNETACTFTKTSLVVIATVETENPKGDLRYSTNVEGTGVCKCRW